MKKTLVLTAVVVLFLGTTKEAAAELSLKTSQGVLRYISAYRQDVALVTYTAAPDGTPDPDDPVLFYNADEPMSLASTMKIVVLAAYAREVVAGRLNPDEQIPLGDWERFYLPRTDGGAHPSALAALGIPADEHGFSRQPATRVPLDAVARAMIRRSDNAATDYLLQRLGWAALHDTIVAAGLTGQEMPRPLLGIFLSWYNHDEGGLSERRLQELLELSPQQYAARMKHFVSRPHLERDLLGSTDFESIGSREGRSPESSPRRPGSCRGREASPASPGSWCSSCASCRPRSRV